MAPPTNKTAEAPEGDPRRVVCNIDKPTKQSKARPKGTASPTSSKSPAQEPGKQAEVRKNTSSMRVNRFRIRQAANTASMKKRINEILSQLNRPTIDFSKKKTESPLEGKPRPEHLPPREERVNMSREELSQWRAEARKRRKNESMRKIRARDSEVLKGLRTMLDSLEQEIAERKHSPLSDLSAAADIVDSVDGSCFPNKSDQSQEQAPHIHDKPSTPISSKRSRAEAPLLLLASIASNHLESERNQVKTQQASPCPDQNTIFYNGNPKGKQSSKLSEDEIESETKCSTVQVKFSTIAHVSEVAGCELIDAYKKHAIDGQTLSPTTCHKRKVADSSVWVKKWLRTSYHA